MQRRQRSNKSKGSPGARVEIVEGRTVLSTVVGNVNFSISPATFPRALAIADLFQFYRFTKVRVAVTPNNAAGAAAVAVGFAPGAVLDTNPTTLQQILELPAAILHGGGKTIDTVLNLNRKQLCSDAQLSWFKTIPGTPDTQWEIQGNIYTLASSITNMVVDWTMEVQSWNLAANSPMPKVPKLIAPADDDKDSRVIVNGQIFKLVTA